MEEYFSSSDITLSGDSALDSLLYEAHEAVQDARDFSLPDDMVINAVYSASDFFGLPHPEIIHSESTWEMPNNTTTFDDDVIGFARNQMMEMGIYGEDALSLVMTHECCHRAMQNFGNLDPWEHELACDYFAGVKAAIQNIDSSNFENALINTQGGEAHPVGTLRVEFIEYGKHVANELQHEGIQPTFENCLEQFNKHLVETDMEIQHQREETIGHHAHSSLTHDNNLSFTGKYSESEIGRLKSDVKDLESELSYKNSDVEHHRRCLDTVNTPNGHKNGEFDFEANQLNKAISDRDYTKSKLDDAKGKLNNAQ